MNSVGSGLDDHIIGYISKEMASLPFSLNDHKLGDRSIFHDRGPKGLAAHTSHIYFSHMYAIRISIIGLKQHSYTLPHNWIPESHTLAC